MESKLGHVTLRLPGHQWAATCAFYKGCGMVDGPSEMDARTSIMIFPEAKASCGIEWIQLASPSCKPVANDRSGIYWKIGFSSHDVNQAVEDVNRLKLLPNEVGKASQFENVGWLTHFVDPAGYIVEILGTTFETSEEQRKSLIANAKQQSTPAPAPAINGIGQITLRVSDKARALAFYTDVLGMKLICVESVSKYGFFLFFLAYTEESPPKEDLEHVDNREWCYQRPYTTLELQWNCSSEGLTALSGANLPPDQAGFDSFTIFASRSLRAKLGEACEFVKDPDGTLIYVKDAT
mmetsp:Transcript_25704/g.43066  ORF Transcript_25704/g.43066 Transcript_25704/m.43066 type:complete len:294 (-) Transcript_25704:16-897(-)